MMARLILAALPFASAPFAQAASPVWHKIDEGPCRPSRTAIK
jgi:hypothetical protein